MIEPENKILVVMEYVQKPPLTLYLIETPFNPFANRADPDQAALVRADPILVIIACVQKPPLNLLPHRDAF